MKCENCFCVYQHNGECILATISVDISGMCTKCIYADIDQEILSQAKINFLDNYKNR